MFSVVRGSIAAAYTKAINAPYTGSFNPAPSGRRTYDHVGSFASPNYLDTPGWTAWPAGGPKPALAAAGSSLQARYTLDRFEGINVSGFPNHSYALAIGGAQIFVYTNVGGDTGWFDISAALAGAITFHDWLNNTNGIGGTAFVGNVTLFYQYIRS